MSDATVEQENADIIADAITEVKQIRNAMIDLRTALSEIRDELRAINRQIGGAIS